MTPTDFEGLLRRLLDGRVDFILVEGVAGAVHGAARATYDLDVVYDRPPPTLPVSSRRSPPSSPTSGVRPPACRSGSTLKQ